MERQIFVSAGVRAPLDQSRHVMRDEPGVLLVGRPTGGEVRARRFRSSMSIEVEAGRSVTQGVIVEVGEPAEADDAVTLPVGWEAHGTGWLYPSFRGELRLRPVAGGCELELQGSYAIPPSVLSRFGDGVAGRRVAQRALRVFVGQIAGRLEALSGGRDGGSPDGAVQVREGGPGDDVG